MPKDLSRNIGGNSSKRGGEKVQKKEFLELSLNHDQEDFDDDEEEEDEEGFEEDTDDEEEEEGREASSSNRNGRKFLLKNLKSSKLEEEEEEEEEMEGRQKTVAGTKSISSSEVKVPRNKQRTLLISSRGVNYRYRHLMQDLNVLMPHSKKDAKLDSKSRLEDLNELAELNNCNNCIYFEMRKHQDMYMWLSKTPNGPSVKFMVKNVHTMDELKMTGNCLKGSRPILSFDGTFDSAPHLALLKEMFTQAYAVPTTSRKIKPFIDHVMSFSILDNKIWVRNYQIIESEEELMGDSEEAEKVKSSKKHSKKTAALPAINLVEIGPRFVLEIMRIFDGSFGGSTLYENPNFVTANNVRRVIKGKAAIKHAKRQIGKEKRQERVDDSIITPSAIDAVFD